MRRNVTKFCDEISSSSGFNYTSGHTGGRGCDPTWYSQNGMVLGHEMSLLQDFCLSGIKLVLRCSNSFEKFEYNFQVTNRSASSDPTSHWLFLLILVPLMVLVLYCVFKNKVCRSQSDGAAVPNPENTVTPEEQELSEPLLDHAHKIPNANGATVTIPMDTMTVQNEEEKAQLQNGHAYNIYNTFPFGEEFHGLKERQSDFLLDLYSHMKQYESKTGRSVLPALLPLYQLLPDVWYIQLSERNVSVLLEVLKLQTEKKPVELIDFSDEESVARSFLQCLPYISQLRCKEKFIPRLCKAVVNCSEDTELVRAFFAAMDLIFTVDWVLSTQQCRALGKVLKLSDSKLKLALKSQTISLRGAGLLFRNITHLQKLCLSVRVVKRMVQALRAVRAGGCLMIEELCLDLTSRNPETFTFLSSLSFLLNIWTVHSVNLTECKMEAQSLINLMCHPGNFNIRLSKETLQQFTDLLCEVQDGELTSFFLKKVGGDLTSCSLSWDELIHFLQQRVCNISVTIRKTEITYKHAREILPLLSEVQFKRLNPSVMLSIIREIYETRSATCVSSLLNSTHNCINLNKTELNSYLCTALCFTLQHCTSVSLSLLWTSIPEGELVKLLPLFNRVSQLSVDRSLLLKLLHCCSISELQQGAAAVVFSALQNRLDFSCSICLDLSSETQDFTLHLTNENCRDISTAIQKSQQLTELILEDCEMEDAGLDMFSLILHTVRLCCSKSLLLRFLGLFHKANEPDCVRHAMSLSQALNGHLDLSETLLDLHAFRSLALFLEFSEGLSELDLSHCQITYHSMELLFPYLHKAAVLDLSHNNIDDCLAERIYNIVSISSNIQTVRLFKNRITNIKLFREDKRFEIW